MPDTFDVSRGEALRTAAKWAMTADDSLNIIQEKKQAILDWTPSAAAWRNEITKAEECITAEEEYRVRAIAHAAVWAQIAQATTEAAAGEAS